MIQFLKTFVKQRPQFARKLPISENMLFSDRMYDKKSVVICPHALFTSVRPPEPHPVRARPDEGTSFPSPGKPPFPGGRQPALKL